MAASHSIQAAPVYQLPVHGIRDGRSVVVGHMRVLDDAFTREVLAAHSWSLYGPHRKYAASRFRAVVVPQDLRTPHTTSVTLALHRVVYSHYHGVIPYKFDVDHIDRDTFNNLPDNLRVVGRSVNNANSKIRTNNRSGFVGVSWCKRKRKWRACIGVDGKRTHLGYFDDAKRAAAAVNKAYLNHYPDVQVPNPY